MSADKDSAQTALSRSRQTEAATPTPLSSNGEEEAQVAEDGTAVANSPAPSHVGDGGGESFVTIHADGETWLPSLGPTDVSKTQRDVPEKGVFSEAGHEPKEKDTILTGMKLFLAFVGMLLGVFLIALDQTIIAPALPIIASDFQALNEIGWISSAYFITQCGCLLLYGQLLTLFNRRYVFISSISIFELGSLVCALAPNVVAIIISRAVAGIGAGGIFVSCFSIIADVTRLEDRPKLLGAFGGVFAVSSVIGPLMGGAFTDHLTWRWCFWINLPIGAITIFSILFVIPNTSPPPLTQSLADVAEARWTKYTRGKYVPERGTFMHKVGALDFIGCIMIVGVVILFVLPLQWGGAQYAWNDPVIIGTFCGFGVFLILFLLWEWKLAGESCIMPLRFFKNPTQIGTCLMAFFMFFSMLIVIYYLPIFYQAVRGSSATSSGIHILPTMLAIVMAAGFAGFVISATGYYWPFLVIGPVISTVGSGLLYTLQESSNSGVNIGYQVVFALGLGFVMQNTVIAIQANVDDKDIPQATSLVTFTQLIGGTMGIAIATTVFDDTLASSLHKYAPDAPFGLVRYSVESIRTLDPALQLEVIHAYVVALERVFIIGVPASGLALLSAFLIKNRNIKGMAVGGVHAG